MIEAEENINKLINALSSVDHNEELRALLGDLLSADEINSIALRLEVAKMLYEKNTYSDIVAKTDASAYMVNHIERILKNGNGGYKMVIERSNSYGNTAYSSFAYIYDALQEDVNYPARCEYIQNIFKSISKEPKMVLDLACGTGTSTLLLAKAGYDMIGLDSSSDMLLVANDKAKQQGMDILFLNQPMEELELYGTVDAVLCLLDGINYLLDIKTVKKTFSLVHNYLNPGGVFIFDINTKYKIETILGNNTFASRTDNIFYIWENYYDPKTKICQYDLSFFVSGGKQYELTEETHYQKAYTNAQLCKALTDTGFDIKAIYNDLSFEPAHKTSEKVFFVAEKRGEKGFGKAQ